MKQKLIEGETTSLIISKSTREKLAICKAQQHFNSYDEMLRTWAKISTHPQNKLLLMRTKNK